MTTHEPALRSASLLGSIALLVLGGLGSVISLVALLGLTMQGRFSWGTSNGSFILLLLSAIAIGFGIVLYRRAQR